MHSVFEQEWIQHPQQPTAHPPLNNCVPQGDPERQGVRWDAAPCTGMPRISLARAELIPAGLSRSPPSLRALPGRCTAGETEPPPAIISRSLGRI